MGNNPLITVITVVLNAKVHIEQTIQSVINQTYPDIEYIVIDGGSTDGTLEVIKKYEDKITLWKSESDKGIFDAMNKGIDLATGEWINFMNAGDHFYTNDVLEQVFKTENADVDVIYGDSKASYYIGNNVFTKYRSAPDPEYFWKKFPCHQSEFYRTSILKTNNFCIFEKAADAILRLDLYHNKKVKFKKINKIISYYAGGGFSAVCPFEKPQLKLLKNDLYLWSFVRKYKRALIVDFYYFNELIINFIIILVLKFMPANLRYFIFKQKK